LVDFARLFHQKTHNEFFLTHFILLVLIKVEGYPSQKKFADYNGFGG